MERGLFRLTFPHFQSNIQENKDWNSAGYTGALSPRAFRATSKRTRIETGKILEQFFNSLYTFRATSKRTRIETRIWGPGNRTRHNFQSNIQENKDWNSLVTSKTLRVPSAFRATSKRTRIETRIWGPGNRTRHNFQSNIQENKDWNNTFLEINTSSPLLLSEQHPREQGLKHKGIYIWYWYYMLSEQHPREQGLKPAL